ncbi:MAG TPA: bifunctional riboflavin kinase/FAD synthetase [Gemmatimonadaceae bacterium]|nr:bifunctional riboflavin kinase/FAD synthetase [Gemmatimonadaceae bacterium]
MAELAPGLPALAQGSIVTVGTFDGVHRGHQDVLARLVARARERGLPSALVTFDPHPLEVVNPQAAPALLTAADEKLEVIAESGIDYAIVVPFTVEFSHLSAEAFVTDVLQSRYGMRELLIGHDHGFGRGRTGDTEVLRALGARRGFRVDVVPPVGDPDGRAISSTAIRRAVAGGDLERAAYGLGRLYSVSGRVVEGAGRGRGLGYRTINIDLPSARKLLPPEGVYAVKGQTHLGTFGGMMNLGGRPTFGERERALEVHLFDADGDWYGRTVRIDFVARLRDTQRFQSAAALAEQLRRDETDARRALTDLSPGRTFPSSAGSFTPHQ